MKYKHSLPLLAALAVPLSAVYAQSSSSTASVQSGAIAYDGSFSNFAGNMAVIMSLCPNACVRSSLRAVRSAARFQRVRKQFDPVLAPECLPIEHIGGRAEHI